MSRERSLSWASPAFGAIRPIGSWWATEVLQSILSRDRTQNRSPLLLVALATDPNLSISGACDKQALTFKGPCRCPFPLLQAPRARAFHEFSEDSHAAKPPCAG